uniref:Uncharacterized protein n=1 Tax=Rhizophagus irregularis (strain DAOM 181602 / DAOM 197198 / MUCL 43194) TaxID=747089 RepID=U9SZ98_RHIID
MMEIMSDAIIDKDSENKPLEPAQPHPIETVIEMPQNQYAHVPQNVPREPLISTKITNMSNNVVIDIYISKYLEQSENEIEENKSLEWAHNVQFCNFNLKGEFIIWCTGCTADVSSYYKMINIVCIYSIQSGKIPKEAEVISISKHDKIWFLKNNDLYEWDITTAYATIIYRNIYGINTKEIKIFNNEDYTCIRLKDERIVVYSIQLGFPIALFELKYLESSKDSKDSDRKRDKLIKRMYNLMTKDQTLSCLLLSLLDSDCLNKLIRTRSDELIEPPKQDPSNQPNTPNQSNLRNLFYRSEHQHTNYRFVYHNHTIKVDKVEPSEELKANNYEYENTNFSELKEGKYHLEKGSMIWKFRMEELEKVSMNSKRSDAESELRNNLLKDLDEKEPKDLDAELMIKNLKKILSKWKSDDMSLEVLERLEKKKKSTEQEDKIQLIEKLINELKSNEKKQKIKIDLENYFLKKIKQINKKGSFDEGIKQSLVEKVIDPIQEKIIKYLNEDGYLRRFVIELQNDAKDIIKTIGGIFKEKHIEDLRKLKDDYYDENKRVVSELLKIRDLIKRSYIIEINKIIETNPDKDKRNEKINDLEKKFIKEIEVTKIKLFVKKLLIKTKRSEKDFSTNVELLTDDEIECILESMIEEVEHYNGITLNKTNDGIKELVKKIDKQKERNTNEHEGVPRDHIDQIEQNFDIKELVKNLTKIIIKIGIIVNKPKPNRFGNLFQTTSQLKEYIEGNKFEDLKEENLSNINEKFNKFEILIEKLVKDYTKEIDKIESNKSGKNILEDILAGERANGIIIDKVEKAMIKESAKMFIEENVKIRINRAKETFIKSIETASEEQQESQKSKIKESVNKFIEFVEELDKIEDINEIEEEVKNFITNNFIEENATTDGTEENNLKNATEIKNSVDEFIKWVNKKERITKFKKLENLIREIGITEIEKLGEDSIKPADDFIDHIETKIEELESDSKPEDIINNIRKFKIEKLANINEHERNEIINNIVICKINDELVKDSTERISTFKKLENENSEWRKELKENFIKRKNKIEELAVDPKKFEFQITDSLKADRDLVRLFCDLNEESIDILMGQMINNDEIAILTKIGFFIFRLNKDVRLNSKDRELISLNYFYYVHDPEQSIKKVQKMIGNPKVDKDARHCCGKFLNMTKKRINSIFSDEKPKPTITFIVPYIKFVSYPHEYDWWKELIKPKPSPFVKTINRSIYKTWNGEALINFKWNLYGKYYYFGIWILFTALLGCFTAATTLTRELIPDNIRERLLIASIILGFIHFIFEFRQFIYDPIEWILDPWNYFDLGAYLIPTLFLNLILYYHANFDETRRKVLEQIKNDEWNNDEFPEMKRNQSEGYRAILMIATSEGNMIITCAKNAMISELTQFFTVADIDVEFSLISYTTV